MSFADELRASTKTKDQLDEEKRQRLQKAFESDVQHQVNRLKAFCKYAAEKGQRKLSRPWYWSDDEEKLWPFNSKDEAKRYADAVIALLNEDGLTDVEYQIKSSGLGRNRSHSVYFEIRW